MKTFISDDGRIIIHVDEGFEGKAEIMVGDAPPFEFDPSILIAIGEHYMDYSLASAKTVAEALVGDLEGDDRQAAVARFAENLKQLTAMREKGKPEPVMVLRCTGCGTGYDGPLMDGFICAECSSVWDSKEGKWKHPSGITPLTKAQLLTERSPRVPPEAVGVLEEVRDAKAVESPDRLCPLNVASSTGHYDPAGEDAGKGPDDVPVCAGCGMPRSHHKTPQQRHEEVQVAFWLEQSRKARKGDRIEVGGVIFTFDELGVWKVCEEEKE